MTNETAAPENSLDSQHYSIEISEMMEMSCVCIIEHLKCG